MPSRRQHIKYLSRMFLAVIALHATWVSGQTPQAGQSIQRATRDVVIRDLDETWDFRQVYSLLLGSDGNVYAWDSEDFRIRVFDKNGKPVRLLAGKGQGPGELSQLGRMSIVADTLWVFEPKQNRVSAFALRSGGFRTFVLSPKTGRQSGAVGRTTAGYWLTVPSTQSQVQGLTHVVVNKDGVVTDTILEFQPNRKLFTYDVLQENVRGGPVVGRQVAYQPFQAYQLLEPRTDGGGFILATSNSLEIGAPTFSLAAIDLHGQPVWSRAISFNATPFSDVDYHAEVEKLIAPTVVKGLRLVGSRKMITDSLIRPRNWPPFTALIAGSDGSIWLKHGSPSKTEEIYWRFSALGEYETSVAVPLGFRLMAASKMKLWGTRTTADGEVTIERYSTKN